MTNEPQPAGRVDYLNPPEMSRNPAFTQVVVATGPSKTVYIGAQTAVDANGMIIGAGDIALQTQQVLKNIDSCLAAAGAAKEHLVMWSIYINQGQPIGAAFGLFQAWWGGRPNPPANTVLIQPASINLDFLIAIDAVAVVPLGGP